MDTMQGLTIQDIDDRASENESRLKVVTDFLEKKTVELGAALARKLPTDLIHKAIEKLETERRELTAGLKFLVGERESIQQATARKAAETALGEYAALVAQCTPLVSEIIKGLCSLQTQVLEFEKIENDMREKSAIAGKLIEPALMSGVLVIPTNMTANHVYQALNQIARYNGKPNIEKAGIYIVDIDAERAKIRTARSL